MILRFRFSVLIAHCNCNPGMARERATAASAFIHEHYTWPKAVAHMSKLFSQARLAGEHVETEGIQFFSDDEESVTE